MKIALRYYSKSKKGNTLKLASAIEDVIGVKALKVDTDLTEPVEKLILVNAMYAATIDKKIKAFLKNNKDNIKLIINVNSAASGASTLKAVKKVANKLNIPVSDKEFHCVGSWLGLNKDRPNKDDLDRLKEFVKEIDE